MNWRLHSNAVAGVKLNWPKLFRKHRDKRTKAHLEKKKKKNEHSVKTACAHLNSCTHCVKWNISRLFFFPFCLNVLHCLMYWSSTLILWSPPRLAMALALWSRCKGLLENENERLREAGERTQTHGALLVDGCVDCGYSGQSTSRWHGAPNHPSSLGCVPLLSLSTLGRLDFSKWNHFGTTLVLFLLGPSATLLMPSLLQGGLDTRNVSPVAHFLDMPHARELFMHWPRPQSSLCDALPSS